MGADYDGRGHCVEEGGLGCCGWRAVSRRRRMVPESCVFRLI